MPKKLKVAVVGLGMGVGHAEVYARLEEYELAALCDLSEELIQKVGSATFCKALYIDYAKMLSEVQPDVVCIATPNTLHFTMTMAAVEARVKGIYCEKPIAMNMAQALQMQKACAASDIKLAIGHQRRVSLPYITMRQMILDGAIGQVTCIRGSCAGDFLTDGTHLIDSIMYLNGDLPVKWVLGQVYRGRKATKVELEKNPWLYHGSRYGHNVEEGALALFEFDNGVRAETQTGTIWQSARGYQDIEVFGTKGRLLRAGDSANPALLWDDGNGWKPVELVDDGGLDTAHAMFADTVLHSSDNSMGIDTAIKGFELVMAIYESARLHSRLELPLTQMDFPLDLMLKDGQIK